MDAIGAFLERHPGSPIVLDVLATLDPAEIRAQVHELEPDAVDVFFFAASAVALFGVRRHDGSRVAIKLHKLFTNEQYFDHVHLVQAALADAGLGAPRPLGRRGLAVREEWLDEGTFRDAHERAVRTAMAQALARFHATATATGVRPRRPFLRPLGALWPKPHNVLFDFEATAKGAEWIDEIGWAAREVPGAGVEVVGHTDWAAKHLRFDDHLNVTAMYDWDSVTTDLEPRFVGTAAGSFTYTEELGETVSLWPTADESLAFIADYEAARVTPFTKEERHATRAACVYLRAYAARCQHAYAGEARSSGLQAFAESLLG